ncbi:MULTISPECIES: hypothetical protein [unclassified Pseudomonas]|uniref:hypothetical protein n=1 Tax=unclassified Pseudomonas TaxID=196821 RepID=UPI0018E883D2|nr:MULTISPECIES: hypothetical protein [unclassified Pseudomonas]MBJ2240677.1 hypothetical protein [Pseudomonas sp. MF6768]MBJ2262245.1 hypothetical protein [Pseudomonas sp. MF6787]
MIKVTPATTITIQISSLAAQAFLLLAFFLPLKVLILLGSDTVPQYYPAYLKDIQKNHLIVITSSFAFLFYLLYIVSELVIFRLSKLGAARVLLKSAKLNLFNNQENITTQIYSKFNRGLAAGIFALLAIIIVLYIYPLLFAAIVTHLLISALITTLLYNKSTRFQKALNLYSNVALNTISALGFLTAFLFMIVNFIYFEPPRVFAALISLLLIRQALSRLALMIQNIIALRAQHRQTNALFFYGQQLSLEPPAPTNKIKELLKEGIRDTWILKVFNSLAPEYKVITSTSWHQLSSPGTYAFEVELLTENNATNKRFLVKLFDEKTSYSAEQEATLISFNPTIPSLKFYGSAKVENLHCHVFELDDFKKTDRRNMQKNTLTLCQNLISVKPSETLALKFSRSHLYLEQRLLPELFEQIKIVAPADQSSNIDKLISKHPIIIELLSNIPRQFVCLDLGPETLLNSTNGDVRVSHWANWKMEAAGSNWPTSHRAELEDAITHAKNVRPELKNTAPAAIILCALLYAFERHCLRTNYAEAIALLPDLLDQLESAETYTSNRVNSL